MANKNENNIKSIGDENRGYFETINTLLKDIQTVAKQKPDQIIEAYKQKNLIDKISEKLEHYSNKEQVLQTLKGKTFTLKQIQRLSNNFDQMGPSHMADNVQTYISNIATENTHEEETSLRTKITLQIKEVNKNWDNDGTQDFLHNKSRYPQLKTNIRNKLKGSGEKRTYRKGSQRGGRRESQIKI